MIILPLLALQRPVESITPSFRGITWLEGSLMGIILTRLTKNQINCVRFLARPGGFSRG